MDFEGITVGLEIKFGFGGAFDERCVPCFSLAGDHMGSPLQIALK